MISQSLQIASADISELNVRLLDLLTRDASTFSISVEEMKHYLGNKELVNVVAERGMSLFVTHVGNVKRPWQDEDLQLRFDFLLVARDLVIQRDPVWAQTWLGIKKELVIDLTSATKRELRDMAQYCTPWETRFPVKIFEGLNEMHDPKFIQARMMLSGS